MQKVWVSIATCHFLGRLPKAPGTWGSLVGIPVGYFVHQAGVAVGNPWTPYTVILLLGLLTLLALKAIAAAEAVFQTHDNQQIVIDEVLGQAIVVAFLPQTALAWLAAFASFRFFDILKPGPVGWADRQVSGALGTLLDDVIAGLCALALLKFFF